MFYRIEAKMTRSPHVQVWRPTFARRWGKTRETMPKSEAKWGLSPHWSRQPCGFCPNAFYHMLARVPRGLRPEQTTIIHSRCPVTGEFLDGNAKRIAFQLTDEMGHDTDQVTFESNLTADEIVFVGRTVLRMMA